MADDYVDPDMFVVQQGVAGAEQKHRRVEIPLQFEPCVRAGIEGIAHAGITSTDERGGEDQPVDEMTDPFVHRIDQPAYAQQQNHCGVSLEPPAAIEGAATSTRSDRPAAFLTNSSGPEK